MTRKTEKRKTVKPKPGNSPVDFSEINPADYDEQVRPFEDVLQRLAPVKKQDRDTEKR